VYASGRLRLLSVEVIARRRDKTTRAPRWGAARAECSPFSCSRNPLPSKGSARPLRGAAAGDDRIE
jgi:hypothetical protein